MELFYLFITSPSHPCSCVLKLTEEIPVHLPLILCPCICTFLVLVLLLYGKVQSFQEAFAEK